MLTYSRTHVLRSRLRHDSELRLGLQQDKVGKQLAEVVALLQLVLDPHRAAGAIPGDEVPRWSLPPTRLMTGSSLGAFWIRLASTKNRTTTGPFSRAPQQPHVPPCAPLSVTLISSTWPETFLVGGGPSVANEPWTEHIPPRSATGRSPGC